MLVAQLSNAAIQHCATTQCLYTSLKGLVLVHMRNFYLPATCIFCILNCHRRIVFASRTRVLRMHLSSLFAIARMYMYKYYEIFNNHFLASTRAR